MNEGIKEDVIARTIEQKTHIENNRLVLREETSEYYVLEESLAYGEFLKQVQKATGLPVSVMHRALCAYNNKNKLDKAFFNRNTLTKFIEKFQIWFEEAFIKRFSYKC